MRSPLQVRASAWEAPDARVEAPGSARRIDRMAQRDAHGASLQQRSSERDTTTIGRLPVAVPATFPSSDKTALQAQLGHVHPLGSLGSLQALVLWQRRIYSLEKTIEE
jgi:hypothetical protein